MSHKALPPLMLCLLSATAPTTAAAQERDAGFTPVFEFTPFIGYRTGSDIDIEDADGVDGSAEIGDGASFGIDLGLYRDRSSLYELLYSRKEAELELSGAMAPSVDVTTEYIQFGGTLLFEDGRAYVPWLSMTIGATRFAPDGPYDDETRFSGSLGGGFRFPFSERVAATLGVRGYLTLLDSDTGIFCVGSGGVECLVRVTGSTYFEAEASAGISVRF